MELLPNARVSMWVPHEEERREIADLLGFSQEELKDPASWTLYGTDFGPLPKLQACCKLRRLCYPRFSRSLNIPTCHGPITLNPPAGGPSGWMPDTIGLDWTLLVPYDYPFLDLDIDGN
jgi:hypothetical protein